MKRKTETKLGEMKMKTKTKQTKQTTTIERVAIHDAVFKLLEEIDCLLG